MNFLTGLGYLGGGIANSGLFQGLQQAQQDQQVGAALYGLAGQPLPDQSGGQQGMGSLMSGAQPQQQQAAPAQVQPPAPIQAGQLAQAGGRAAQPPITIPAPTQQPSAAGQASPALPAGQPMTASAGGDLSPSGSPPAPSPQQGPTGTAALAQQQQPDPQQQQQQQQRMQTLSRLQGKFDTPIDLVSNLVKTKGMTPRKLGAIVRSDAFKSLLSQQGLAQYRAAMGGIQQERIGLGYDRLAQQSDQFAQREARLQRGQRASQAWREQAQNFRVSMGQIQTKRSEATNEYNNIMRDPNSTDEQKAKATEDFQNKMKALGEEEGKLTLPEAPKEESGDTGGQSSKDTIVEEGKAAISQGADPAKVKERIKQMYPDVDTSGM